MTRHFVGLLVLSVAIGCGGGPAGPPRYDVSGSVTYDGKPLPVGHIMFQPDTNKGNSGPATTIRIVDGEFNSQSSGTGVVAGEHRVYISGYDGVADVANELPDGMPLFRRYEQQLSIEESNSGLQFDVPKGANEAPSNKGSRPSDV